MTTDPHSTAPEEPPAPDAPETPGAEVPGGGGDGWKRWMPRRRVPADAEVAAAAPAGAERAESPRPADGPPEQPTGVTAAVDPSEGAGDDPPAAEPAPAPPRRRLFARRTPAVQQEPPAALAEGEEPEGDDPEARADRDAGVEGGVNALRRRRKRLLRDREVAVYHLGGLTYELHRRDLLDQSVLRLRAEAIGLVDETVHAIDLRLEEIAAEREERRRGGPAVDPTAGNCLACRATFMQDARFCWQCGSRLTPGDDEQITQMIAERQA